MDADSPLVSRLERTFWTVWYYISGAVHRLLRPEQENSVSNNPSSLQDSAVDSELAKCHHEDEARGGEVQEEPTLSTASPLSSARTAVAWDLSTSEIDLAPDENKIQDTADLKDFQTDVGTREEEECVPTGDGESQRLIPEYNKAEKGGGVYQEVYTHRQAETLEDDKDDESMITRSQTADIASSIEETERVETPDFQSVEDTPVKVQDQEENALNFETDSVEIELSTTTDLCPKEEVSVHKEEAVWQRNMVEAEITKKVSPLASRTENKSDEDTLRDDMEDFVDGELQVTSNTSVPVSKDEPIAAEPEFAMAPRNSNDESDSVDERMNSPVEEEGQEVVIEDERVNKAEVPEHKGEIHTVTGDSKEEVNSSAQVWCISDALLHAETELHVEERLKDVVDVQIMITEIGDETLSSGAATNEKAPVKSSSVPADEHKSQVSEDSNGKTGQEVSWGLTGQSVVAQDPKPPTCGGPEDIHEPEPDENPAQSLLEVGDPENVLSPALPGEVENQEPDSLHKSDSSTDALEMRERTEQGQESKEERESYLDLTASEVQETQKLHVDTLVQEAGFIPEEENRELLVSSLRTGIDDSDKESEADFCLTGEKDLQDREEDVLIEMSKEECDPNDADAPGRFMETEDLDAEETVRLPEAGEQTVKPGRQESVDAVRSGQSISKTRSLIQDITATEFLEQSVATEPEQQYTVTDLEKATNGVEQSAAEVEVGPELGSAECPETALSNEKDTKTHEGLNSEESGSVSDTETSLSTAESGFSDQAISDRGTPNGESQGSVQDMFGNVSEPNSPSFPKLSPQQCDSDCQDTLMRGTDEAGQSSLKDKEPVTGLCFDSAEAENLNQESEETKDDTDEDRGSQEEVNTEEKGLLEKTSLKTSDDIDVMTLIEVSTSFRVQKDQMDTEALVTFSDSQDESEHTESACAGSSSDVWSEEGISSTEPSSHDDTSVESEKGSLELPSLDKLKCLGDIQTSDEEDELTTKSEHQNQADVSALDFTAQRSRIAVKNPQVRPPKDPRSLILMSSLDPTPDPHLPGKLPLGGMGIGIKLPGLGAGFPVLKKTQQKDEARPESLQKESETRSEETSDSPKQDEEQHERKWMPPRHPGFGNPLMSELKTRLNKTTKD
ncbi:uncharacterized protein LOC141784702 [Halichoeres trimaculatus]|uniref:uncharacterized protein LOC141784702 n=1 Tax=Halichoeres trimaculatus TaxID=147232 RepID=UPI003D9DC91E